MRGTADIVIVDVEAWGASPVAGRMTEFGAVAYDTGATFHGLIYKSQPDPVNPAVPLPGGELIEPLHSVMARFAYWLRGRPRAVFVSDNPAYDWQWISAGFAVAGIENPFGYSARRIGDFYAGLTGDWRNAHQWKRLRVTKHDHNPVNDALGNAEALRRILAGERVVIR